ncbi:hypothetical protein N7537_001639 [Penicillium hordei]|uniref:Uncharacterized protein n=1 Tax=Penicillium hordei TaxID=40994 RepID=A0AAD6EH22_9EURO|nr:uncharacterized protein N7537_001639 [Penicillium hordei]KAJ5616525.1 hypothetical protein N7537_001639 [Penicillium hordei]
MACSSTRNFGGWLRDLSQWRGRCQSWIEQEWENKCNDPAEWKEGNAPGFNLGIMSSQKHLASLPSLRHWKIMNPPDRTSVETQVAVDIVQRKWSPKNVRLSDAGVIYSLLTLSADYRIRYLTYDFDQRGDIRKDRVPKAPTVAFYQNNQRTLATWKGIYVFTGGYNDAGWLLADNYPDGPPFFQAGLVVASSRVKTFDALNVQLTEYQPKKVFVHDPNSTENLWKRAYLQYWILLRGCNDISGYCLVLAGQSASGYQKMGLLFGFHALIGPGADATDANEAIQQDQIYTAWKNKLSPDVEVKTQPNDFINFIGIRWGHLPIHTNTTETNTTEAITTCRKRRRPNSGNETKDLLSFSSHSSSIGRATVDERSPDRADDESNMVSFNRLWAELAAIESPPRYWELFTAVGTMETMHRRWRHNRLAMEVVKLNISSSEATVIRDLIQNPSPRLASLLLGIGVEEDRIALENAFSYNSAMALFQRQVNVLEDGPVKQAYADVYSYFQAVACRRPNILQPLIKLEQ